MVGKERIVVINMVGDFNKKILLLSSVIARKSLVACKLNVQNSWRIYEALRRNIKVEVYSFNKTS